MQRVQSKSIMTDRIVYCLKPYSFLTKHQYFHHNYTVPDEFYFPN